MAYKFADSIQRGILYLAKADTEFYSEIINLVKPEYFEFNLHSAIFTSVVEHCTKYKVLPTDAIIATTVKEKHPTFSADIEEELNYINTLDYDSVVNKSYYLDIIERYAKKEALKQAISKCVSHIQNGKYEEVELEVKNALTVSRSVNIGQNYFNDVQERWQRLSTSSTDNKFSTLFNKANIELEGGTSRKELCLVAAASGRGKSLYLVNQAAKLIEERKKILYVSLEMSEDRIAQRFDSILTQIPQSRLKVSQDSLKTRLSLIKNKLGEDYLVIKEFPTKTANVNHIRALLNQLQTQSGFIPDVLIVDYLELLNPTTEGMTEYQAQERIAQELRGVAMERNILVWTASQVNRQGARTPVITDTDLADSYGKIRSCDFALSLNQTDQEFDEGRMRIYIMKSRNGKQRFLFNATVDYDTLIMGDYTGPDIIPELEG
jgi:replicative DNA helicase